MGANLFSVPERYADLVDATGKALTLRGSAVYAHAKSFIACSWRPRHPAEQAMNSNQAWRWYAPSSQGFGRTCCGIDGIAFTKRTLDGSASPTRSRGDVMNRASRTNETWHGTYASLGASPDDLDANNCRSLSAQGRQGTVRFFLQRVEGGLYVEREEIPKRGPHNTQSIAFPDSDSFERWCDDDPVRFEHPLLYVQLKREAGDLWQAAQPG